MSESPSRTFRAMCLAVLALAVLAAFEPALRAGWTLYDDPVYVTANPQVRGGLTADSVRWALTSVHGGNWHPLTSLSHLLDVTLFGLDPRGPHTVNVLLHAGSALLLAHLLFRWTGAFRTSLLGAALFALHPLRVESVAWISERKDVLSAFLFLATLLAWQRRVEEPTPVRRAFAFGLFVLGLLAKPMLVTLPFVLLLLDVWPFARHRTPEGGTRWAALVREKLLWFAASAVSCAVTFAVQRSAGAVAGAEDAGFAVRAQNAVLSVGRYLGATLWPADLSVCYPFEAPESPWLAVFLALTFLGVTALLWLARRRRPALLIGWLWWLGMLVPVIGLVQVGAQSHADRYTYLPSIGLVIAVLFGAAPGAGTAAAVSEAAAAIVAKLRRWLGAALVVACLPLLFATRAQAALWKDTRTLFCHALAVTNDNALAELIYGNALREDGDTEAALPHLRRAVQLAPGLADAHDGLGIALGATNRLDDAVAEFRAALRIEPRAGFHHNLGHALALLGRGDEAAGEFVNALRLDPAHAPSHEKLGAVLADLGRFGEAELAALHAAEAARARGDEAAARRFETQAASWRARRTSGVRPQ